jgi:hypothetical protein
MQQLSAINLIQNKQMNYNNFIEKITNDTSDLISKISGDIHEDKNHFRGGIKFYGDGKEFNRCEIAVKKLESQSNLGINLKDIGDEEIINSTILDETKLFHQGYLDYLFDAWKNHQGIIIGPWHIWNIILYNLKELNKLKPTLTKKLYTTNTSEQKLQLNIYSNEFDINQIIGELKKNIPEETFNALLPSFLNAPQNYNESMYGLLCEMSYDYYDIMILSCGIPEVKLEGILDDWNVLLAHTKLITDLHSGLNPDIDVYLLKVCDIVKEFVENYENKTYWLNFFEVERCGSGSQTEVTGHIKQLFTNTLLTHKLPTMMSTYIYKLSNESGLTLGKFMSGIISSSVESNISVPHYETITTQFEMNQSQHADSSLNNEFINALKFINSCYRAPVGHYEIPDKEYTTIINDYPKTIGLISAEDVVKEQLGKTNSWTIGQDGEMIPDYPDINEDQYKKQLLHIKSIQEKNKGKSLIQLLDDVTTSTINRTQIFKSFWYNDFVSNELTFEKLSCYNFCGLSSFRYLRCLPLQDPYIKTIQTHMKDILEFYEKYSDTHPYYIPILFTFNPQIIGSMIKYFYDDLIEKTIESLVTDDIIEQTPIDKNSYESIIITTIMFLLFESRMAHSRCKISYSGAIDRTKHVGYICLTELAKIIPSNIKEKCLNYVSDMIYDHTLETRYTDPSLLFSNFILDFYKVKSEGFSYRFVGQSRLLLLKYYELCKLFNMQLKEDPIKKCLTALGHEEVKLECSSVKFQNNIEIDMHILGVIGIQSNDDNTKLSFSWKKSDFEACAYFLTTYHKGSKSHILDNMISNINDNGFIIMLLELVHDKLDVSSYSNKLVNIIRDTHYYKETYSQKQKINEFISSFDTMSKELRKKIIACCNDILTKSYLNLELAEYTKQKLNNYNSWW